MDFFEREAHTRRSSRWLVVLFVLAVLAIVAATVVLVLVLLGQPANPDVAVFSPINLRQQAGLMSATAILVTAGMALASLFRSLALRAGGGKVARELGGQLIDADTRDPQLRQLQNVVEEVALASGVPVPEIYVLEQEEGINAFAAGNSAADAAIAVTRGTLDKLSRDELQGVIAHEFSHILNGDMRLNIKLMGLVFGILVLAIVGQRILFGAFFFGGAGGRRRDNNAGAIMAIGIGLLAIGYIGMFFARWIKAAVARQRESLADASAVQFTRQTDGIAGALKKIAVYSDGSLLQAHSEEVSHMLFGDGAARNMFATHPPLMERIRAIEPNFQEEELKTLAEKLQREAERDQPAPATARSQDSGGAAPFDADTLINRIGQVDGQTLAVATAVSGSLPPPLLRAARKADSAPYLMLLLLLDADDGVRDKQLQLIRQHLGDRGAQRLLDLMAEHGPPNAAHRLPLLDAALPGLKRRSPKQLAGFIDLVDELSEADNHISPFEFMLMQILRAYLRDVRQPPKQGNAALNRCQDAATITLAALAHFGNAGNGDAAQAAYNAGAEALKQEGAAPWPDTADWPSTLRQSLEQLDRLAACDKRRVVHAWITAALQDKTVVTAELELLRAFCVAVHVPMPPLHQESAPPK